MLKILLVEDDSSIRKLLKITFKKENYFVDEAETGSVALDKLNQEKFDIVLLDLNLPEVDGLTICEHIRKNIPDTGIIMITAMGSDMDKLIGFEYGADDYIVKPFNPMEVIARITAVLRRMGGMQTIDEDKKIISQNIEINLSNRIVLLNKKQIHLTPKEYDMLVLFVQNPQKLFTREDILNQIWGKNHFGEEGTVDVLIRRLREKIENNPKEPYLIKTVWGSGYRWEGAKYV